MSTYDPSLILDRDKVRLNVGDTDNDFLMLEDSEIAHFLDQENDSVLQASEIACIAIAGKFARDVNYRFSTMWQDSTEAFNHYMQLAKIYKNQAASGGQSNMSGLGFKMSNALQAQLDDDKVEAVWIGMHDNPSKSQLPE